MMTAEFETNMVTRHGQAQTYAGLNGADLLERLLQDKVEADATIDLLLCHAVIGEIDAKMRTEIAAERQLVPA